MANTTAASPGKVLPKHALGMALLLLTAVIWIVSSFLSESLVTSTEAGDAKVPPLLLTYLATSLFTIYLPAVQIRVLLMSAWRSRQKHKRSDSQLCYEVEAASLLAPASTSATTAKTPPPALSTGLGDRQAMTAALWSSPLWFLAQFTFNLSLAYTSVTSNTILSSTSSLFTFGLSILVLGERFTVRKLACIMACIAGTVLVTLSDKDGSSGSKSVWGDLLCLVSAALYASYTVVMRWKLPDEDHANVAVFFGYIGLFCTMYMAPIIAVLLASHTLSLRAIPQDAYLIIVLEGLLDYVLADFLWAKAVLLLGPTVATLGLSIQIPLAAVTEAIVKRPAWMDHGSTMAMTLTGAFLILLGFFGANLKSSSHNGQTSATADSDRHGHVTDTCVVDSEQAALLTYAQEGRVHRLASPQLDGIVSSPTGSHRDSLEASDGAASKWHPG